MSHLALFAWFNNICHRPLTFVILLELKICTLISGIASPQIFTGQVKYAYIHSAAMKYSAGSLILTRHDEGWMLEVLLDNSKSEEPVVAVLVS